MFDHFPCLGFTLAEPPVKVNLSCGNDVAVLKNAISGGKSALHSDAGN